MSLPMETKQNWELVGAPTPRLEYCYIHLYTVHLENKKKRDERARRQRGPRDVYFPTCCRVWFENTTVFCRALYLASVCVCVRLCVYNQSCVYITKTPTQDSISWQIAKLRIYIYTHTDVHLQISYLSFLFCQKILRVTVVKMTMPKVCLVVFNQQGLHIRVILYECRSSARKINLKFLRRAFRLPPFVFLIARLLICYSYSWILMVSVFFSKDW